MDGRCFVEGLYQALFLFNLASPECYLQSETKIKPDLEVDRKLQIIIVFSRYN